MAEDFQFELPEGTSEAVPLLALWRTYLPLEADHADAERLHGTLLARCRAALADEKRREWTHQYTVLVEAAEMGDAMAWCELAGGIEHLFACQDAPLATDLKGSCLWLAARGRSRWANWMLVGALIEAESALTAEAHLDMIGHLCRCLPNLGTLPEQFMRRVGVEERLKQLWLPPRPAPQADAESEEEEEGIEAPPMNGMVVLGAMPPMPTGRDDQALVKRYAVLAEPVLLAPVPDADVVAAELLAQFPWMANAVDAVRIELALARHCGARSLRLPPLLLVGDGGIGKSRLARKLAAALGIPMGQVSAAGSSDNRALAGTARGWGSMCPCLPLTVMLRYQLANPMVLVDEVDKTSSDRRNGAIVDTLLTMLEPTTAREFPDEALLVPADLGRINWVLLANDLDLVPPLLRQRCRIMRLGPPRPQDFDVLLVGCLDDLAMEYGCEVEDLPELEGELVEAMRWTFATGRMQARQLAALVRRMLGAATSAPMAFVRH
ncbi:MAG: AAA ATPase [Stygiobacter sp.]|nr:MAG: AAA ATPase [Stygiobacter sp.]